MSYEDREDDGVEGGFNPARLLAALRRRWRLIASIAVVATIASVIVAMLLPNRYEAAAIVQLDPRKKNVSNVEGVMSDLTVDTAAIESEAEIIRSRNVILKVIDKLDLRNDPEFSDPPFLTRLVQSATSMAANAVEEIEPPRPRLVTSATPRRDELAAAFSKKLSVGRVRNTLLLEIRFTSYSAEKAALIANTIAEVYVDEQLGAKTDVAQKAATLLDEQLESLRRRVSEAEKKVEDFKAAENIFASEGQILSEKELARLMEQTVQARNRTAETRARFERARNLEKSGRSTDAMADVLASHTVRLLKDKAAEVSRRRAELATRYGPRHPAMIKIAAEYADAERQLSREITALVSNLENEYEEAAARERELIASLERKKEEETARRTANVRLNELEREAETSRQVYKVLLARYKENASTGSLQLPDSRIVEFADTPLTPAAPKRKQIVALATAGGLALGLALALVLEFATPGIGRPEDAEALLSLEHISSLPRVDPCAEKPGDPVRNARLMIAAPTGPFAEAIRAMRREIDVRQAEYGPRIILVAGSLPGEGASVVASNLAHYYALTGDRILLVDADLRRSNLTRQLGGAGAGGLAEALAGKLSVENAILRDQLTNLHFLPASGSDGLAAGQAELLASPIMPRVLGALKRQFDVIVIDAPPLLPVIDTRVIADFADQIVFVMAWRKTPKHLARKSLKLLSVNAERIAGVVVNQVAPDVLADGDGIEIIEAGREPVLAA